MDHMIDPRELHELDRLLELTAEAREAELAKLKQKDAPLAKRLERLLAVDAGFPNQPQSPVPVFEGQNAVYRPIELIGRGATAQVWLGVSSLATGDEAVAIKILDQAQKPIQIPPEIMNRNPDPVETGSFVPVLDWGTSFDGRHFAVMPLVRGEPIDAYADARALNLQERMKLFIGLCEAVKTLHDMGVVHGDIKPSNVLIDTEKRVHLIDCDTAIYAGGAKRQYILATRLYAAPEVLQNTVASVAEDVYSLGMLLSELVWAKHPVSEDAVSSAGLRFKTRSPQRLLLLSDQTGLVVHRPEYDVAAERAILPSDFESLAHGTLGRIVASAVAADVEVRTQSVEKLVEDLQAWLHSKEAQRVHREPSGRVARRSRPWIITSSVLVLIIVGLLLQIGFMANVREQQAASINLRETVLRSIARTGVSAELVPNFDNGPMFVTQYLESLSSGESGSPLDSALSTCILDAYRQHQNMSYVIEALELLGDPQTDPVVYGNALVELAVSGMRSGLRTESTLIVRKVLGDSLSLSSDDANAVPPALITLAHCGNAEEALELLENPWTADRFYPTSLHSFVRVEVLATNGELQQAESMADAWLRESASFPDSDVELTLDLLEQLNGWIGEGQLSFDWVLFLQRARTR